MSLEVTDLTIDIGPRRVVDGVSFAVPDGARVGLIGESGSGKSLTALAILGLLPDGAAAQGSVRWNGRELIGMPDRELATLRGDEIGIVFQEPRTASIRSAPSAGRSGNRSASMRAYRARRRAREPSRRRLGSRSPTPSGSSRATRTRCPAANASASRSRWRWPAVPGC